MRGGESMVYISVYIPEKKLIYDFKVSTRVKIYMLKGLILEAVYGTNYDDDFVRENYLLLCFNDKKALNDDLFVSDYSMYDGEKFLLI